MSQTNLKFVYDQIQLMASGTADVFNTDEQLITAANKYNSLKNTQTSFAHAGHSASDR